MTKGLTPIRFNGRIFETVKDRAARAALVTWWDCPADQFYARAKQEAPRMRGSQGASWVQGLQIEGARHYEAKRTVPWAGK